MNAMPSPLDALISTFNAELFADACLQSPLAKAMFERGEVLKFFLPVHHAEGLEWGGVAITISGVSKGRLAREHKAAATPNCGNGHSSNPRGLLRPGDYGVHSHPDTARLLQGGCDGH